MISSFPSRRGKSRQKVSREKELGGRKLRLLFSFFPLSKGEREKKEGGEGSGLGGNGLEIRKGLETAGKGENGGKAATESFEVFRSEHF